MQHPLTFIPSDKRKSIFLSLLALTLILFAVFRVLDAPLRTPAAPNGIVSFELAGTVEQAIAITDSWKQSSLLLSEVAGQANPDIVNMPYAFAAFGLGLDYLFMPAYALTLSLGILLAAGRHAGGFAKVGAWLGWGALIAPFFDAVENFALWQVLLGDFQALWPRLAAICATVKFILLLLGLAYALIGWLWPKQK
jgi:hypothetical protein